MEALIMLNGLTSLKNYLIGSWIGPAFLIVVAAVAITFLMNRQIRQLAMFAIIVTLVALFIFGGEWLFGENGVLTNTGRDIGQEIRNIILLYPLK